MLAVPSRTNLALVALTGRAVLAVRGVLSAASMVPGLAAWLPGRDTPLRGRPDWLLGLGGNVDSEENIYYLKIFVHLNAWLTAPCCCGVAAVGVRRLVPGRGTARSVLSSSTTSTIPSSSPSTSHTCTCHLYCHLVCHK